MGNAKSKMMRCTSADTRTPDVLEESLGLPRVDGCDGVCVICPLLCFGVAKPHCVRGVVERLGVENARMSIDLAAQVCEADVGKGA